MIRKMLNHFWDMIFDFIIEEREYEEIENGQENYELSPESFYINETREIETPILLQFEEWDYF